jgi:hypothetical protein
LGETKSVTDCVNFPGMIDPSSKAGVLIAKPGTAGAAAGAGACAFAGAETTMEIPKIAHAVKICLNFILRFSPFGFGGSSM